MSRWPHALRNMRSDLWPVGRKGSDCIAYILHVDTRVGALQVDVDHASVIAVGTCLLVPFP